jgi:uncharacterized protein YyaL (SSP411 family)
MQSVQRYVMNFLRSPSTGVFYVSQDADLRDGQENASYFKLSDRERRAKGIPRINTHIYARENGWMIAALCVDYAATGDVSALSRARRATDWIVEHRSLPGGGFRHSAADIAGPYLGDSLAMGQAYLALYNVTGDRKDLKAAAAAARFIAAHFAPASAGTGFVTSQAPIDAAYRPHPNRDENIALVRFASMLAVATGDAHFRATAVEAMRYLAAKAVALAPLSGGVLRANQDVTEAPIHVAIVGPAKRPDAVALYTAALRSIASHELIEIRDPADPSPLPTSVTYPKLDRAALFLCTARACSSPVFKPEDVRKRIQRAELQSAR